MDRVLHGGDVYRHKDVIDFSANLNPLGMPPAARQALIEYVDEFSHYPDPDCVALTEAIAAFEGVDADKVVVTAGATDAFERIAQVLKPRRALVVAPSYAGYEEALRHVGTHVVRHKLSSREGFRLTDKILAEMDGTDVLFIANPNNPTGLTVDRDLLEAILRRARTLGSTVVLDECFIDLTDEPGSNDLLSSYPNLIIVKALTKTYALAGLRLGYALTADVRMTERLKDAGAIWAVSVPAEVAGIASLRDTVYLRESRELIRHNRDYLMGVLASEGLSFLPGQANFLLFEAKRGLFEHMLDHKVLIRPCANFTGLGPSHFRICVRTRPDSEAFADALSQSLEELA